MKIEGLLAIFKDRIAEDIVPTNGLPRRERDTAVGVGNQGLVSQSSNSFTSDIDSAPIIRSGDEACILQSIRDTDRIGHGEVDKIADCRHIVTSTMSTVMVPVAVLPLASVTLYVKLSRLSSVLAPLFASGLVSYGLVSV